MSNEETKDGTDQVEDNEDTSVDDDQIKDEGGTKEEKDQETKTPELSEDEKAWLELGRRYGSSVTPSQMLVYAQKGWEAFESEKGKKTEEGEKGEEKDSDEEDDDVPVTRAEYKKLCKDMKETKEVLQRDMRVGDRAAVNQVKLESLLTTEPVTKGDPYARNVVEANTYRFIGAGKTIEQAFGEAVRQHKEHVARQNRIAQEAKVKANATKGSGHAETEEEEQGPKFPDWKHSADDFKTGEAHRQAMELVRLSHAKGTG